MTNRQSVTHENSTTAARLADLRYRAGRARRLAMELPDDTAAAWLMDFAAELEAEAARLEAAAT